MTKEQIKAIHVMKGRAGLNEKQYRTLLLNVASVESCKDLSNAAFEDCMAVMEESVGNSTYWREKVARRGQFANERMIQKISELHSIYDSSRGELPKYELGGLVYKLTHRRTRNHHQLTPHEAWKLIELLKAVVDRLPKNAIVIAKKDVPF